MAAAVLDARTRPQDGGLATYDVECFGDAIPSLIPRAYPPDPAHGTFDVQAYAESLLVLDLPPSQIAGDLLGDSLLVGLLRGIGAQLAGTLPGVSEITGALGPAAPVVAAPTYATASRRWPYRH